MRIHILGKLIFVFLGLIIAVLVFMQIIQGDYYYQLSCNNRIRVVSIDAPRGRIYDRHGAVLADNQSAYNIAVVPQDVEDADALFSFVGKVLKRDPKKIQRLFKHRKVSPLDPVVIAEDVERSVLITIEENRFQYPGLEIEESFKRFYPYHENSAHVVGYVGKIDPLAADVMQDYGYTPLSLVGKIGAEQFYESVLQGTPGGRQIEVNSRGQQVRLLGTKDSVKGKDIALTIDERIQTTATQLLDSKRGSIVVMDMANGQILGMVSSPSFDPDAFTDRVQRYRIPGYFGNPFRPLVNRAISGQYPPGSVFKIPVALAALERAKINPETTFECPGFYMLGKARFGCAHVHGRENLLQAIAHSCNVYFYQIGQLVAPSVIGAYAKAFGLTRPTGIDLPFESSGLMILPGQKKGGWFTGNTLNLSIGQGDTLTTPLQLTVMISAVANDGIVLRPRILRAIDGKLFADQDLSQRPIVRLNSLTWRKIQDGMRQTVADKDGTAHLLNELTGMTVSGKTGTAQAGRQGDHAWFVGYVRSPKNNLAFCVFLEHGGSSANAVVITRDLLFQMQSFGII